VRTLNESARRVRFLKRHGLQWSHIYVVREYAHLVAEHLAPYAERFVALRGVTRRCNRSGRHKYGTGQHATRSVPRLVLLTLTLQQVISMRPLPDWSDDRRRSSRC